jgi:hypothetical protein
MSIGSLEDRQRRREDRKWTAPRQHALRVFATAHLCHEAVRESNTTTALGAWDGWEPLTCYWQTFRWMVAEGYAEEGTSPRSTPGSVLSGPWARLTPKGLSVVRKRLPELIR